MSQPPPVFPNQPNVPYIPPQGPKTNGLAITSLVCGLLGCFPIFITALLAIVFGIMGLNKSKQPQTGGKGLAIAGIVLGVLGLIWAGGFFAVIRTAPQWGQALAKTALRQPAQQVMTSFITSLSNTDAQTAASQTTTDLTLTRLEALSAEVKAYGALKSVTVGDIDLDVTSGKELTVITTGTATFENSTKNFTAKLTGASGPQSTLKISDLKFE